MHPLLPLHLVIGALGALALGYCLSAGLPKTALLVAVACAYSWGALIVEGLALLPARLRWWRYREWEGRYYEFEGRQVRIEEGADGEPWALAEDALEAMRLPRAGLRLGGLGALEYRRAGRHAPDQLSLAGIRRLRAVARDPAAGRFERWFLRSVHVPAMKRAGRESAHSPPDIGLRPRKD